MASCGVFFKNLLCLTHIYNTTIQLACKIAETSVQKHLFYKLSAQCTSDAKVAENRKALKLKELHKHNYLIQFHILHPAWRSFSS